MPSLSTCGGTHDAFSLLLSTPLFCRFEVRILPGSGVRLSMVPLAGREKGSVINELQEEAVEAN